MTKRRPRRKGYKKLKSIDPFYKGPRKVDKNEHKYNRAPVPENDRKMKGSKLTTKLPDTQGALVPLKQYPNEPQRKWESMGDYLERVNRETGFVLRQSKTTVKTSGTDIYLRQFAKNKTKPKINEQQKISFKHTRNRNRARKRDECETYEKIDFGDIVEAPPKLKTKFITKKTRSLVDRFIFADAFKK